MGNGIGIGFTINCVSVGRSQYVTKVAGPSVHLAFAAENFGVQETWALCLSKVDRAPRRLPDCRRVAIERRRCGFSSRVARSTGKHTRRLYLRSISTPLIPQKRKKFNNQ